MDIKEIYKENADFILRICERYIGRGKTEIAEDIRQEVFLKILNTKKKFKQNSSIKTWLYAITFRCCMDYWKIERRHKEAIKDEHGQFEFGNLYDSQVPVWEVNNASEMSCPISQLIIELYYGDGWSREEIGAVFGYSQTYVHKKLQLGIKQLKKILQ
jgi:RNA polymerase sigma-70 factor (ECF subfamily)